MSKARILVTEDESIVAMDIKNRLQKLGYEVPAVSFSGDATLRKVSEFYPDLILMDIKIKGEMDGITTAEKIQAVYDIPIIYLTANADEATIQRAKLTTPYGYLLKPFEERELQTAIEVALYKHQMERKLKESEQWLSTTLTSIGDAVIATDIQGRIKFMNPIAETLTGWSQAEVLGHCCSEVFNIIHGKTGEPQLCPVKQVIQEKTIVYLQDNTLLVSKNGAKIPIDDSAAPIKDGAGHLTGVVLVFRDVTGPKQAEEKLRQYTLELQLRNEDLNAFAHTVAHDLQSPLNPLIGFAELLIEDENMLPEERRQFLQIIVQSGRKMSNIIDELMLLAQVRQSEVKVKPLKMDKIISDVRQRLNYMIEEHQALIIDPGEWPDALGYGPWVEEIWVNYLSNGIKYGGQPPQLHLGAAVGANGMVYFWVKDNGPGLSAEEQVRLFTPFTQINHVRANGHGLGLSIVRQITEKLGGQVKVESEGLPGQGSTFSFTLPGVSAGKIYRERSQ
jgi:PAS domain S-box-containing protein